MSDPTKRPANLALVALALAAIYALLTYFIGYRWANSHLVVTALIPLVFAALFSFVGWWHAMLVRKELLEREDQERVRKSYSRDDLFADSGESLRLAANAHQAFDRWFVTSFTVLAGLVMIGWALLLWRGWADAAPAVTRNTLQASGLSFFMFLFCLLTGSYYNGLSREAGCRWLRPVGSWLLLAGAIYLVGFAVMVAERFSVAHWDHGAAKVSLALIVLFGLELIFNWIIEFYRPRIPGEVERPLYESRLLALLTEPGSVASNVAHALDYQFGFKVSETWFYAFLERAVVPIVVLLVISLYLLNCFVRIESDEIGIRERFSKPRPEALLEPGLRLKYPWPIDRVRRVPVGKVLQVRIGYEDYKPGETPEPSPEMNEETRGDTTGRVIVWNKHHFKSETRYLVAADEQNKQSAPRAPGDAVSDVPVNFLTTSLTVYYQINRQDVMAYAYNYRDPAQMLTQIASRETVSFLSSKDFIAVIAREHAAARAALEQRIRAAVAASQPSLGLEVVYVALSGSHPPVEVAEDFQNVVAASETEKTMQLEAEQYAAVTRNGALGESSQLLAEADAYYAANTIVATGEATLFERQLEAYRQAPRFYKLRAYLDVLEAIAPGVRKYLVAAPASPQVLILDLQEKLRPDLLQDLDLNAPEH